MTTTEQLIHDQGEKVYGECSLCLLKGRRAHNCWYIPIEGSKKGLTLCSMCDVEEGKAWKW